MARNCDRIRVCLYTHEMIGGDYRWFECELSDSIHEDCDMVIIKLNGDNFRQIHMRPEETGIGTGEETLLIGYLLGTMSTGNRIYKLTVSSFSERITSFQTVKGMERFYIDK